MKRLKYDERFKIPIDGNPTLKFYTKKGLLLATGFIRIVIGGRGPYMEFDRAQIAHNNIHIPKHAEHKLGNSLSYYWEYRSNDDCFAKLYDQKICVGYADYKVGMWYISPDVLKTDDFEELMLPLYVEDEVGVKLKEETLFDKL